MISCGGGQVKEDKPQPEPVVSTGNENEPKFKIGDKGPGGGIVFFNEGGQYKECSEDLGFCNWYDASRVVARYRGGEFDNWKLPDKDELDLMYKNLHAESLGEFYKGWYWSSSQSDDHVWKQNFNNGKQRKLSMNDATRLRAVRVFEE